MIPLFNGDIIEVRFTHNRTINEDATIYGEGTAFITLSMIEVE